MYYLQIGMISSYRGFLKVKEPTSYSTRPSSQQRIVQRPNDRLVSSRILSAGLISKATGSMFATPTGHVQRNAYPSRAPSPMSSSPFPGALTRRIFEKWCGLPIELLVILQRVVPDALEDPHLLLLWRNGRGAVQHLGSQMCQQRVQSGL